MPELIYIVEDETNIRELLGFSLQSSGYRAESFADAESCIAALSDEIPSLMIFDIMLPGMSGTQALAKIRASAKTECIPVILLTARDSEIDKITGLDSGADDYMTKPFSVMELLARVRALLRRTGQGAKNKVLHIGTLEINRDKRSVSSDGKAAELTYKEYELLCYIYDNQSRVVSRDELLCKIWGYDFTGETRTLDIHISSLRQKLGKNGSLIKTVRNVGYTFSEDNQ